jgi:transposase
MEKQDARYLSPEAQEDLRRRIVHAVRHEGMSRAQAVRAFGVGRTSLYNWLKTHEAEGEKGLRSRPRGRPAESRLKGHQAATVVRLITDRCPDQLKMPFALWTREAVQELLVRRYDLHVSVWTVGRYLKKWGFTPQKPLRRAYEQDPESVRRWLKEEYPAIRRQADQESAEIHWGDEMGLRSDHQGGRSYGRRGQTPVILGTGKRFGCNLISTLTNRGRLAFMVFKGKFNADVMIRFLRRLLRQCTRKIFLILDRHPVHLAAKVTRWLEKRVEHIRVCFLPTYSPDLNPDEYLNQDVKSNALARERPRDQNALLSQVRGYLRSTQRQPNLVRSYFRHRSVTYAAG